ncbi:MAG: phage terminase large subunit family protein, partial [Syntrophales bacterium LBB04]|nr:phage terminase large subunit family protein [Syntrophales bacterium LBB04]
MTETLLECDATCPEFSDSCAATCPEYRTYNEAYSNGLAPIPHISVSDFADAEVRLPQKGNKEPGQWRTSRTPYLKEIMNNLGPWERTQYTTVVKGTQLGFTTVVLILFAYVVKYCPQSIL